MFMEHHTVRVYIYIGLDYCLDYYNNTHNHMRPVYFWLEVFLPKYTLAKNKTHLIGIDSSGRLPSFLFFVSFLIFGILFLYFFISKFTFSPCFFSSVSLLSSSFPSAQSALKQTWSAFVSGSLHVAVGQIQSRSKSPTSYTATNDSFIVSYIVAIVACDLILSEHSPDNFNRR